MGLAEHVLTFVYRTISYRHKGTLSFEQLLACLRVNKDPRCLEPQELPDIIAFYSQHLCYKNCLWFLNDPYCLKTFTSKSWSTQKNWSTWKEKSTVSLARSFPWRGTLTRSRLWSQASTSTLLFEWVGIGLMIQHGNRQHEVPEYPCSLYFSMVLRAQSLCVCCILHLNYLEFMARPKRRNHPFSCGLSFGLCLDNLQAASCQVSDVRD